MDVYTVEDYYKINPGDKTIWELIKGTFRMSPAPLTKHQRITGDLYSIFHNHFHGKKCQVFFSPFDVILGQNVVQPDVCVICDITKLTRRGCAGSPDFITEVVSESNSKMDTEVKLQLYEEFSVKEYWIVFPEKKELWKYVLINEYYTAKEVFTASDIVTSSVFSGITVNLKEIFDYSYLLYED